MTRDRCLVVGVATVEEMDPVLPAAVRLAEAVGAELHVLHVFDPPDTTLLADGSILSASALDPDYLPRVLGALASRMEAQVRQFSRPELRFEVHALPGAPHLRLAHFAAEMDAEVLVIGATRHGRLWRDILGTTAERVLRAADVPVLVLHEPFFRPVQRILLTTDLSDLSARVHDQAIETVQALFGQNPLELRSLLVVEHSAALALHHPSSALEALGCAAVERFLAARAPAPGPVAPRTRLGDPSTEVNVEAEAWRADLIVLGTHGRTGLSRYVFGSVAASVLRDASRNVLVIPAAHRPFVGEAAPGAARDAAVAAPPHAQL
jgi:nucleotide-binding universal stress UspA family protein